MVLSRVIAREHKSRIFGKLFKRDFFVLYLSPQKSSVALFFLFLLKQWLTWKRIYHYYLSSVWRVDLNSLEQILNMYVGIREGIATENPRMAATKSFLSLMPNVDFLWLF